MRTLAEIHGPRGQQDASPGGDADHVLEADARTARNTAVSWAGSSRPEATRTTAPANVTSITGVGVWGTAVTGTSSVTIGTNPDAIAPVMIAVVTSRRAAR